MVDRTEKEAIEKGKKEGQKDTVGLMCYLAKNKRNDDIIRSAVDPGYLEILFKEYQNTDEFKETVQKEQQEQKELEPQDN